MKTVTLSLGRRQFVIGAGLTQPAAGVPDRGQFSPRSEAFSAVDLAESRPQPEVNFWEALTSAQRDAFTAVARERIFAAGATLMQEGEQGDHVVVIRRGWTRICVDDGGQQRVIAERGPGQLIGERSALQVSVRSASVMALDTVSALVMTTAEFADFIAAHQSVLRIVESQVYGRLIEQHAPARIMRRRPNGENWTVVFTDVVGFGRQERTARDRRLIRRAIPDMMHAALGDIWPECEWTDRGDGVRLVIPPDIATRKVVECLIDRLPQELKRHNRTYAGPIGFQLRAAMTLGSVTSDDMGPDGPALILGARLLEAAILKQAMCKTGADLGLIMSDFFYETAVQSNNDAVDCGEYRQIHVKVKETRKTAWMRLIGGTSRAIESAAG
jgi:CRP-like cAMP-binding protein